MNYVVTDRYFSAKYVLNEISFIFKNDVIFKNIHSTILYESVESIILFILTIFRIFIYTRINVSRDTKRSNLKRLSRSSREIVTNLSEVRAFIARPRIITLFSFRFAVDSFSGRL